jgi:hypothetical protein
VDLVIRAGREVGSLVADAAWEVGVAGVVWTVQFARNHGWIPW